jgi:hypothetical protein
MAHRTLARLSIVVALATPAFAAAEAAGPGAQPLAPPAAPSRGVDHGWRIRTVVVAPNDAAPAVGGGVDWRITRGNMIASLGLAAATSPAGHSYGFIRFEATASYDLGPLYLGGGLGSGTFAIDTPGVGSGKWTGAAVAPFVQLGRAIDLGRRAIVLELRGGTAFPFGSIDPMEPVPASHLELGFGIGLAM